MLVVLPLHVKSHDHSLPTHIIMKNRSWHPRQNRGASHRDTLRSRILWIISDLTEKKPASCRSQHNFRNPWSKQTQIPAHGFLNRDLVFTVIDKEQTSNIILFLYTGAHQLEPPSPLISWVNPFLSRLMNRTVCFPRKVSYLRESCMSPWQNKVGWSRTQKPVLRPFSFFTIRPFLQFCSRWELGINYPTGHEAMGR